MIFRRFVFFLILSPLLVIAQHQEVVRLVKVNHEKRINIFIGTALFTSFLYPDSLEKPVLFPIRDAGNQNVTRGFPLDPATGDPTDHPHHIGLWFTYEDVNGIDFWNNSFAIPPEKKPKYGWIKTDTITEMLSGPIGILQYHANWVNQHNQVLLEETTRFEFSGSDQERMIDRITELKADTSITFTDAKDGLLGLRMAHALQIPDRKDQQFSDNKGNITLVNSDTLANGNYLSGEGKSGDSVWSTRSAWCMAFGKIGNDSVSITIFDHRGNPNYPTFWHARGYGLFAANPLGEKIFTKGKSSLNLKLKKGETVRFSYRILIHNGKNIPSIEYLNHIAKKFQAKSGN